MSAGHICGCAAVGEEDEEEGVTRCGWLQPVGSRRGGCRPLCNCKERWRSSQGPVLPFRWGLFKSDYCPLLDLLTVTFVGVTRVQKKMNQKGSLGAGGYNM